MKTYLDSKQAMVDDVTINTFIKGVVDEQIGGKSITRCKRDPMRAPRLIWDSFFGRTVRAIHYAIV